MKKNIVIAVAFVLAVSMAFTACGNSQKPADESSSSTSVAEVREESSSQSSSEASIEKEEVSEPQSSESSEEESDAEADEELETIDIQTYAEIMQEMLDALGELYGEALTIEATAEGDNTLVITYTLLSDELGLTAENIAESMKTEGEKMQELVPQMESMGIMSPVIIVKWIGADGSELFNQEYK